MPDEARVLRPHAFEDESQLEAGAHMSTKTATAVELLNKLADVEAGEIEVDSRHAAVTRNWLVRMFYDYGLEDAKRHLEISTMIRSWLEQGKPPVGKIDVSATELEREADSESSVASLVKQLLELVDDADAKALLQGILSDEEKHERGLRALRQRVLQQRE